MLQTNDEIDLFLALNDPDAAEGAYIAAKCRKRRRHPFVGFDGLHQMVVFEAMDGRLSMTQVYPTGGTEAIESAISCSLKAKELDKTLTLTSEIITPTMPEKLLVLVDLQNNLDLKNYKMKYSTMQKKQELDCSCFFFLFYTEILIYHVEEYR